MLDSKQRGGGGREGREGGQEEGRKAESQAGGFRGSREILTGLGDVRTLKLVPVPPRMCPHWA